MNDYEIRGKLIAHTFFSEVEKIAAAISGFSKMAADSTAMGGESQAGMLAGNVQNEASAEEIPNEAAPSHGVVASRVTQLDPRRAVGVPVLQPPPGYVYNPDIASFVPNEQDPGWLAQQQAIEAARNKGWYDQGQQDVVAGQAQQQVDQQATTEVDQAQAQNAAQQQEQALMQQAHQVQVATQAKATGAAQARASLGQGPGTKTPDEAKKASPAKSLNINIRR